MNTSEILESIDQQIMKLQQARELLSGTTVPVASASVTSQPTGKRRGRPVGSANKKSAVATPAAKKAVKRTMSAEGKARIAAAQKARWATQKKSTGPAKPVAKKAAAKGNKKTAVATKRVAALPAAAV